MAKVKNNKINKVDEVSLSEQEEQFKETQDTTGDVVEIIETEKKEEVLKENVNNITSEVVIIKEEPQIVVEEQKEVFYNISNLFQYLSSVDGGKVKVPPKGLVDSKTIVKDEKFNSLVTNGILFKQ